MANKTLTRPLVPAPSFLPGRMTDKIPKTQNTTDRPRPFVFRAIHLDGQTFKTGQSFHFDLHLFDNDPTGIAYFVLAFAQLAREALGPARRKVELMTVSRLYEDGVRQEGADGQPLRLDLPPGTTVVSIKD